MKQSLKKRKLRLKIGAVFSPSRPYGRPGKKGKEKKDKEEGAKEKLENLTKEAIEELQIYHEKAEFLIELAKYIKERNK